MLDLFLIRFSKEPFLESLGLFLGSGSIFCSFCKSTFGLLTLRCLSYVFLSLDTFLTSFGEISVSCEGIDSLLCSLVTVGKTSSSSTLSLCFDLGVSTRKLVIEPKLGNGLIGSSLCRSDFALKRFL